MRETWESGHLHGSATRLEAAEQLLQIVETASLTRTSSTVARSTRSQCQLSLARITAVVLDGSDSGVQSPVYCRVLSSRVGPTKTDRRADGRRLEDGVGEVGVSNGVWQT